MNVVEFIDVTKILGRRKALDHLNLTIKGDVITGLIGKNGAGKTTLMKMLAGYWHETTGAVKVFSRRPFNDLFVSANVIYVHDQMTFSESLTLKEILNEAGRAYPSWDPILAHRLFDYFSFHPGTRHHELSKGKKSTFNIIIGLASRCPLTMFDEPTTGMDASVRKDFYRALLKDYLAHPRSIILSSHHLEEIDELVEDIILIDEGKTFLNLSIEELKEYAVAITGATKALIPLLAGNEIIFQNQIGDHTTYAVVKADQSLIEKAKRSGMEVSSVAPSDLSIYLTMKHGGGIDDVFK